MDIQNDTTLHIENTSIQTAMNYAPVIKNEIIEAYNVFLYSIIALGIPGNLLVLIVFAKHRPSNTTDWFILFITSCDLLSSLFSVPVYVTFTNTMWIKYGTDFLCKLHMFFSHSIVLSSSFLICGLALDRYIKVCHPKSNLLNVRKARNGCVVTTLITSLLSIPCILMYENTAGRCVAVVMGIKLIVYYLIVFLVFCISTVTVVVAYVKVSQAISKSEKTVIRHQVNNGEHEQSSSKCLLCLNFACLRSRGSKISPNGTTTPRNKSLHLSEETSTRLTVPLAVGGVGHSPPIVAWSTRTSSESTFISVPVSTSAKTSVGRANGQRVLPQIRPRTTRIAFIVCALFVISWLPPWVCFFIALKLSLRLTPTVASFMLFGKMTYLLNTVANPVVYISFNRKFRQHIKGLFTCWQVWCTKGSIAYVFSSSYYYDEHCFYHWQRKNTFLRIDLKISITVNIYRLINVHLIWHFMLCWLFKGQGPYSSSFLS